VILLLAIIAVALALFISGRLRVDLVGLLVLATLALTGLVTTQEALAGFSSPAVITVWAMFILSNGLTRTGLANRLGRPLQRMSRSGEAKLVAAIMVSAAALSALINTVTVAAILLPAVMDVARRSGRPPSRLLLPLALGCLLGGPFTAISTPPNILVTEALAAAGHATFGLFDFTPITAAIVAAGIAFVVVIGRHLLPTNGPNVVHSTEGLGKSYGLEEHLFTVRIPAASPLVGKTLADSRLGSALSLNVVAIQRRGRLDLGPRASEVVAAGDTLVLHGRPDSLDRFSGQSPLEPATIPDVESLVWAVGDIDDQSPLIGLDAAQLRDQHRARLIALGEPSSDGSDEAKRTIRSGDRVLLRADVSVIDRLKALDPGADWRRAADDEVSGFLDYPTALSAWVIPSRSVLSGATVGDNPLVDFAVDVLAIERDGLLQVVPPSDEPLVPGDLILVDGPSDALELFQGLHRLEISEHTERLLAELESQQIGVTEVLLTPRSTLVGRTLGELLFRDHYGVTVLAIWSEGRAYRSGLQHRELRFGDALLVYGHRRSFEAMARDPDFIVVDESAGVAPRLEKAPHAGLIMAGVLIAAMTGQVPIAIAALAGAALMVLSGALSMEEAYRGIDWKVVFLVATMLPLGAAIEHTGAAQLGAEAMLDAVGGLSPRWVVAAFFLFTVIGTQVIPTAALVVMMAPIALSASTTIGISPQLLMMTVAIAASSSFASPVSHPANMLVMGPGGYRFVDYVKIGAPLTLVALLVSVALLPVLFQP
jgi:di/tricarboxylate transporter